MALIDRVKERIETDLSDSELQAMIDAVSAEIAERHGPATGTVTVDREGGADLLKVGRPIDTAETITVTEYDPANSGDASAETELAASDYLVMHGGRTLLRLTGGANYAEVWAPRVRIVYTPISDTGQREDLTIKLVQLDVQYRGLTAEKAGDWSATYPDAAAEREKLLASLDRSPGLVMA